MATIKEGKLRYPLLNGREQQDDDLKAVPIDIEEPSDSYSLDRSSDFFLRKTKLQRIVIVAFSLFATLLLFFSFLCVKVLYRDYAEVNVLHVLIAQSTLLVIVVLLIAGVLRANLLLVPSDTIFLLFARCLIALIAAVLFLSSLRHVSLGKATMMAHTSPVFAGLFAYVSLRETFRSADRFNIFFAFIGAAGVGYSAISHPEEEGDPDAQRFAMMVCSIAAVLTMYSNAQLRQINISAHCMTAPLFLGLTGTFVSALGVLLGGPGSFSAVLALEARALYLLVVAAGASVLGVVILSWALQQEKAAIVCACFYPLIAYGFVTDYVFLGRDFWWMDAAAAGVVFGGFLLTLIIRFCEVGQRR